MYIYYKNIVLISETYGIFVSQISETVSLKSYGENNKMGYLKGEEYEEKIN